MGCVVRLDLPVIVTWDTICRRAQRHTVGRARRGHMNGNGMQVERQRGGRGARPTQSAWKHASVYKTQRGAVAEGGKQAPQAKSKRTVGRKLHAGEVHSPAWAGRNLRAHPSHTRHQRGSWGGRGTQRGAEGRNGTNDVGHQGSQHTHIRGEERLCIANANTQSRGTGAGPGGGRPRHRERGWPPLSIATSNISRSSGAGNKRHATPLTHT